MIAILLGICSRDRAPVEVTTYFSSIGMELPGRDDGSLPVAMMMFLALRVSEPPALRSTWISFEELNLPQPLT
jgi:hypothetical protein